MVQCFITQENMNAFLRQAGKFTSSFSIAPYKPYIQQPKGLLMADGKVIFKVSKLLINI